MFFFQFKRKIQDLLRAHIYFACSRLLLFIVFPMIVGTDIAGVGFDSIEVQDDKGGIVFEGDTSDIGSN